jgi:acyl transferase domain-containing protein/NAD(P)-dependent dehydrogenase (short-subunit alcohol dehydrogenase family)
MARDDGSKYIPLAIIGMGCRLPGADDLDQYWKMLIEGRSAVDDLPRERFEPELYYDSRKGVRGKSYTRRGAIPSSRDFDHDRCPISPELVRNADPTHLVMCQVAAEALRHAGMDPFRLPLRNAGVYVGHTIGSGLDADAACAAGIEEAAECLAEVEPFCELPPDQQQAVIRELIDDVRAQAARSGADHRDLASHMCAGIISKGFGLDGPFMAVNAACASSLHALLLAARALQRGRVDMAIVGGASVCSMEWLVLFSAAQSLSPSQSRPFDHRADGLVVAEGYVAVVVKTLDRALADGDPIQAVIRGVGIASDGKGRSLWAPRREGQVEAIRRAYPSESELADVQYVEAHSTATRLGDATEIASLSEVLKGVVSAGKKIPITSVKANIGHALEAAGLASLVKVVLSMQKGIIPPAVNIERLNPNVDWQDAPVYVPREATPWPDVAGKPRRAGVNAFGIGGLNLHVAVESYTDSARGMGTPAVVREPDDEAVAVIGRGCVFPGACEVRAYWDLLTSGRDARQSAPAGRGGGHPWLGGYVHDFHYDWRRHRIPPKQVEWADPLQFMVLDAADQALAESGYDRKPFDRKRTAVVVGTEFVGDFTHRLKLILRLPEIGRRLRELLLVKGLPAARAEEIERALEERLHARWPVLSDELGSFSASCLAVRLAKTWDLMGGAAAVDSGATSGMAALNAAVDLLLSGDCGMMVWVAAQRNMNCRAYELLAKAGMLATEPAGGPFDRHGSGCVPGEGAGVLLLKRLRDARRDGDPIHAILRGVGAAHDDSGSAPGRAIFQSLEHVGLRAGDLAMAMTDACGVPACDVAVVRAIVSSQREADRTQPLEAGSVVGHVGHLGGASAAASLLAAIDGLEEATMPGVYGFRSPSASVLRSRGIIRCNAQPTAIRCARSDGRMAGIVLSHGKGLAYSAVIERATPVIAAKASANVAHRWVLRSLDALRPAGSNARFTPDGAVLILGESPAAESLQRRFQSDRVTVYRLTPSRGAEALIGEMDRLPAEPAIRTAFVMTGMDGAADLVRNPGSWQERRSRGVELPYRVLQKWGQLLDRQPNAGPCVLAAGTLLGGDFGVSEPVVHPEGGWIAGLLKAIDIEWNRYGRPTRVKICDFAPGDDADVVADAMLGELAVGSADVEVGLGGGRRRVVRAVAESIERLRLGEIPRGSTWLVTGGARGITAEVAVMLGREYDLDLHLVGRSVPPRDDAPWRNASEEQLKEIKRAIVRQAIAEGKSPEKQWERVKNDIEIAKNLERMRRLNVRVTYHACDVADWSALGETLDAIRRSSGPITGIVHGAGFARPGRLETRRRDDLMAAIGSKVDGALGLMCMTQKDPLRWFVGFGSISGRYGGNGLTDYAAANEMLAKLCAWFRTVRPACATTCIQWQSWDAVGMAMLPDSSVGARDVLKMKFSPPEEGVEHLKQELCAGLPRGEVLIEDGEFERLVRHNPAVGEDAGANRKVYAHLRKG